MSKRTYKKPTRRRKPSGPCEHGHFSTVDRYEPPWLVTLYAVLVVGALLGFSTLLSYGYLNGWWG